VQFHGTHYNSALPQASLVNQTAFSAQGLIACSISARVLILQAIRLCVEKAVWFTRLTADMHNACVATSMICQIFDQKFIMALHWFVIVGFINEICDHTANGLTVRSIAYWLLFWPQPHANGSTGPTTEQWLPLHGMPSLNLSWMKLDQLSH